MATATISIWNKIKLQFLTFIFGVWMICKMFAKWIWDPKTFLILEQRDKPPSCLVDSFLGQHKYLKLKGVKYHYVEAGERTAPLILLLHGFPDCWLSWRHQIPALANHFRVVALDLKGFGDSDKPLSRKNYRLDLILEELNQLIASLEVSSCIIVGHGLGALIGWYLTDQFPEIVDKLITVSCPYPNVYRNTLHTSSNYRWLHFVQLPHFPELDALKEDVKLISAYHKHLPSNDTYLEAYKYAFSRKEDWTGPLNYFRNILSVEIAQNSSNIQVPVLLITGNDDKFCKLENIVNSTDFCERFHVKIVDAAGHFPHQEKPHQFNEILLKYLGKKKSIHGSITDRYPPKSIMNRMMKYGNSVIDTVQKKTNGLAGNIPSINLLNYTHIYDKTGSR